MIDPPGDPVVRLLWRAWAALARPSAPSLIRITSSDISMLHISIHTDNHFAVAAQATADPDPGETERRVVDVPGPILWTVADESVARIDQTEGTSTTIYGLRAGTTTITVKAGELRDTASITVTERPATRVDIVPWEDPFPALP